jgi:hypothetical protein
MAVKPGDPILKHLTASWYNRTLAPKRNQGGGQQITGLDHLNVYIQNTDTTAHEIYEPLLLGPPVIDYDDDIDSRHKNVVLEKGSLPLSVDVDTVQAWGVLQAPLPVKVGAVAELLLTGITWIRGPLTATSAKQFVDFVPEEYSIEIDFVNSGRAEVLYHYDLAGERIYLVNLVGPTAPVENKFFTLTESMATFTSGRLTARAMADLTDSYGNSAGSDYVYSWDEIVDTKTTGFKGKAILADGIWLFDQAYCEQGIISS